MLWELSTAVSLLYAGADILVLYHPEAAMALKRTIFRLLDGKAKGGRQAEPTVAKSLPQA